MYFVASSVFTLCGSIETRLGASQNHTGYGIYPCNQCRYLKSVPLCCRALANLVTSFDQHCLEAMHSYQPLNLLLVAHHLPLECRGGYRIYRTNQLAYLCRSIANNVITGTFCFWQLYMSTWHIFTALRGVALVLRCIASSNTGNMLLPVHVHVAFLEAFGTRHATICGPGIYVAVWRGDICVITCAGQGTRVGFYWTAQMICEKENFLLHLQPKDASIRP